MDVLETPYDAEEAIDFIDCAICNKSIRGETLYKIHLTTLGHLQKEEFLVDSGAAVRTRDWPDFQDIQAYLHYLKLDEPIIGLNFLDEVPRSNQSDSQPGPTYRCRLCKLEANLPNMVNHIIGRRHRQRYMEVKRPELVTWDKNKKQSGDAIQAKADMVERQDGRGIPRSMKDIADGKPYEPIVPSRKRQHPDRDLDQMPPNNYQGMGPLDPIRPFRQDDDYGMAGPGRDAYRRDHPLQGSPREDHQRTAYRGSDIDRRGFDEDAFTQDVRRRGSREAGNVSRGSYGHEAPRGSSYAEKQYPAKGFPRQEPYTDGDPLKQFYSEEVKRGRVRSVDPAEPRRNVYPPGDPRQLGFGEAHHRGLHPPEVSEEASFRRDYPEERQNRNPMEHYHGHGHMDERSGSQDDLSDPYAADAPGRRYPVEDRPGPDYRRYDGANGARGHMAREPETSRRRVPGPPEVSPSYDTDHLLEIMKTIRRERRGAAQEGQDGNAGPATRGPFAPPRPPGGAKLMSEIPEPFKRFLEGAVSNKQHGKRKKKSRFSDATKEEVEMAQGLFQDETQQPDWQISGPPRPTPGPPTPEFLGMSRPEPYPLDPMQDEGHLRERPRSSPERRTNSANVLDVLNNIEIENVEEADFLKNKLCSLLKEFQAKKAMSQANQGPGLISKDYNHTSQGPYDRGAREPPSHGHFNPPPRPQRDVFAPAPHGRRGPEEEQGPPERPQEYKYPTHTDPRGPPRKRYEEVFGRADEYPIPPGCPEEGRYPERFQAHPPEEGRYPERFQARPEEGRYPERFPGRPEEGRFPEHFQEPPRRHEVPSGELYDPFEPTSPSQREQGYQLPPRPHQTSSLDKITSTLLELVARKS